MRKIIVVLSLSCVLLAGPISGSSDLKKRGFSSFQNGVSIQVSQDDWGEARTVDIQKVLESAAGELWRYFPNKRLNSITIIYNKEKPKALCKKGPGGEYVVQLSARNRLWSKFAFQFAHEFFHVLSNYEIGCGDNERNQNQWFEETLAEVSSMFVLKKMAITWRSNPPYPHWKDYESALDKYGQDLINQPHRRLPDNKTFVEWFSENQRLLRSDPYLRPKNELIANRLLPLFERSPESWESISYLNLGSPDASNSFQSYLDNWYRSVPTKHKRFVEDVAGTFGMRIASS